MENITQLLFKMAKSHKNPQHSLPKSQRCSEAFFSVPFNMQASLTEQRRRLVVAHLASVLNPFTFVTEHSAPKALSSLLLLSAPKSGHHQHFSL